MPKGIVSDRLTAIWHELRHRLEDLKETDRVRYVDVSHSYDHRKNEKGAMSDVRFIKKGHWRYRC